MKVVLHRLHLSGNIVDLELHCMFHTQVHKGELAGSIVSRDCRTISTGATAAMNATSCIEMVRRK